MINNTDSYTIAWRAWYDNGTSAPLEYNSIQHTLYDLPEDGFQAMRLWYSDGTGRYISGNDYYFFANHTAGTIYGQTNDSYQSILDRYGEVIIKLGKHVPDGMMKDINDLMLNSRNPLNGI